MTETSGLLKTQHLWHIELKVLNTYKACALGRYWKLSVPSKATVPAGTGFPGLALRLPCL